MKTFVKPSGVEVQVNESSEAYALSLGWTLKAPKDAVSEFLDDVSIEVPEAPEEAPRQKRKYTRRVVNGND